MAVTVEESALQLLRQAKEGNGEAMTDLLTIVRCFHMPRAIARYTHKNRLVEYEDVAQEFMIGVAKAVPDTNLDIGNPIIYLVNRGIWAVRSYFRKQVLDNTRQTCMDCGHTCKPNKVLRQADIVIKRFNDWVCPKCGGHNINIVQLTGAEVKDTNVFTTHTEQLIEDLVMDELSIQEFRSKLNGRVLQLFDAINNGVDRDSSISYMSDIANEMGVTTACVAQYLKRLRKSWCDHYNGAIEDAVDRRLN